MGVLDGVPVYELFEKVNGEDDRNRLNYLFLSEGNRYVIKMIEYSYIQELQGKPLYNFGFGDLDESSDTVTDGIHTENGDVYNVFYTVLSTVTLFFAKFPDAVIRISGSDNSDQFEKRCRESCRKSCVSKCKNRNRRIRIYKKFIQKHYSELSQYFEFRESGSADPFDIDQLVSFGKTSSSVCIYVKKRKSLN